VSLSDVALPLISTFLTALSIDRKQAGMGAELLSDAGFSDFAGSTLVHALASLRRWTGAVLGLVIGQVQRWRCVHRMQRFEPATRTLVTSPVRVGSALTAGRSWPWKRLIRRRRCLRRSFATHMARCGLPLPRWS